MEQLTDTDILRMFQDNEPEDVPVDLGENWEEIARIFYRLGRESAPTTVINNYYSTEPTVYGPITYKPVDFSIPPGVIIGGFAT